MNYALITGASSGIGFELALLFAKNGIGLILVSSNLIKLESAKKRIEKEASVPIKLIALDLSQAKSAKELYDLVQKKKLPIHYLINNAGIGSIGPAESTSLEMDEQMLTLNVIVPTLLCKLFLKDMYQKQSGYILNVASTGAFQPGPYTASYFASKSYLLNYSQALRFEAKKHGVVVSTLCPGTTATPFFERAGSPLPKGAMSAKKVACIAYKQLHRRKAIILPGIKNHLLLMAPKALRTYAIARVKVRSTT